LSYIIIVVNERHTNYTLILHTYTHNIRDYYFESDRTNRMRR